MMEIEKVENGFVAHFKYAYENTSRFFKTLDEALDWIKKKWIELHGEG